MARAQFQKGQRVWVESVGAWAEVEKINAVWAKGFDEPIRVTYDIGMGRAFQASELLLPVEDPLASEQHNWRVLRARNKWQAAEDVQHHPFPGTYPVVVTDKADWGGWRVPGAEYDRSPERIEFQARMITAAPELVAIVESFLTLAEENPESLLAEHQALVDRASAVLQTIQQVLALPQDESAVARRAREAGLDVHVSTETNIHQTAA